ncbi:hypothetical protein PUNSTDRAFT_131759 [Punctularia strigosozonata HHB-11173 SS5]|uniref:uncharacterized protein n=1 Tax=Punctularia strigosozonata (strain HHB-11173) TaxID=741275 RepID=UPI00044174DF|nr:uncharacterized protein PUNSTDRAFT_131759 [Punctularia strigosozonata HHB-11173 SS5]EIN11600.1 hypothetical protein PUNSTDRAFT_131759 [Punctularia strigosozonata HHB-11173 SS5]
MVAELPTEIVIIVFDFAASSSTSSAYSLSLVASWTRFLAERRLYSTLCGARPEQRDVISRLMGGEEDTYRRQAEYVRGLWLEPDDQYSGPDIPHLLQIFPNLRNVACNWLRFLPGTAEEPEAESDAIARQKARQAVRGEPFHLTMKWLAGNGRDPFILDSVTHLRLLTDHGLPLVFENAFGHDMAAPFESLTHLAVANHHRATNPDFLAIRKRLGLQMLVLEEDDRYSGVFGPLVDWIKNERLQDSHIYIVPRRGDRCALPWEADARGGVSIWERARAFTEQMERDGWIIDSQWQSRTGDEWKTLPGNESLGYTVTSQLPSVIGGWAKKAFSFRK